MTGSKYWGEERYPDAIYSIYLKKVRYVSPPIGNLEQQKYIDQKDGNKLNEDFIDADYLQWETIRERVIKAGTIQKLVESLIDPDGQLDSRQFNVFFATYRAFTNTENVLQRIIDWYTSNASGLTDAHLDPSTKMHQDRIHNIQKTIKSIIACWLDMYPEDFYNSVRLQSEACEFPLLEKLINFSKTRNLYDLKSKTKRLRELFNRVHQNGGLIAQLPSIARISFAIIGYDPNLPCTSNTNTHSQCDERFAKLLTELQTHAQIFDTGCGDALQIAEQLTFWDALLFRDLKPYQCQGSIWGKRNKLNQEAVYTVRATIDQFNALCQRVITSIVLPESKPNVRAQIIEKWINIAKELRLLNNFSSLKAVLSSLQSQSIFRLENVWPLVSKESMAQLKELTALFDRNAGEKQFICSNEMPSKTSFDGNCRRTKSDLNFALESHGTVPYLGTFLTELAMIDQAYLDYTEEGLINFDKRRQEFEIMARLRLYQSASRVYSIPMDEAFCVWFNFLPALDEKECFLRSLEIQPNGTEQSTPTASRKQGSEGVPQMAKINSLSKLLSSLGYGISTTKELDVTTNSYFYGIPEEHRSYREGKHGSNESGSIVKLDNNCLSPEKPTRGQRSRSQGAKKDNHCKQNAPKGLSHAFYQGISLSPNHKCYQHFDVSHGRYTGSEFNPQRHFDPVCLQKKQLLSAKDIGFNKTDFIFGFKRTSEIEDLGCMNQLNHSELQLDLSSPFCISHNSSFFNRKTSDDKDGRTEIDSYGAIVPDEIDTPNSSSAKPENPGLTKRFQKSTSSSSSKSSLEISVSKKSFGGNSPSSVSINNCPGKEQNFHLIRVGLDDLLQMEHQTMTTNYKCIKVLNGDRMNQVIQRALDKHLIDISECSNYSLVQLLPDGGEFHFPDNCNPFYAVAPDPSSPILNCVLRKRTDCHNVSNMKSDQSELIQDRKKINKQKRNIEQRCVMLRWSSGFL